MNSCLAFRCLSPLCFNDVKKGAFCFGIIVSVTFSRFFDVTWFENCSGSSNVMKSNA